MTKQVGLRCCTVQFFRPLSFSGAPSTNFKLVFRTVLFSEKVLASEVSYADYLRQFGIFNEESLPRNVSLCTQRMKVSTRKTSNGDRIPVSKCRGKKCCRFRSIRTTNKFFTWRDRNGKLHCNLSLRAITIFVFVWIHTALTVSQAI